MNAVDHINKVGLTEYRCTLCTRKVTTTSYFYSMKKWNEPYCFSCGKTIEGNEQVREDHASNGVV